ncbi:hypothetical protein KC331_g1218 [Hortaea werneckii]|nr:hypothetical protein KC331_g1218 [Hortaea werneckii]KAI7713105.1 hypothetical protein KC353_g7799 [Hortaea werneckii]
MKQDSRLLDLPPELRNSIYTYVLTIDDVIQIPESGKPTRPPLLQKERKCLGTVTVTRGVNGKTGTLVAGFAAAIQQTDNREKKAEHLNIIRQRELADVHASHQTFTALSVMGLDPERIHFDPPPGPDSRALIAQMVALQREELSEVLLRYVERLLNDRWVIFMRSTKAGLLGGNHDSSVRLGCESVAELRSKGYTDREIFGLFTRARREGMEQ